MGYKAAAQVLKEADVLKAKLGKSVDLLNDSEIWTSQQQLQTIYHQVLVLDLEYALDKKVEQELWMLGFKNHIGILQDLAKDKKNPRRHDSQALLSWCLEAASGFYLTLLQELCTTFDVDLPFRRRGSVYGQIKVNNICEQVIIPQSSSCLYICQYCLVHLGDIARYRNQRHQAESFYKYDFCRSVFKFNLTLDVLRQAILVSPTSGQPYNQLALLEASQGNKLSTVFHYVRGIAVKNPFPASTTNLFTTLSTSIDKNEPISEVQTKMSVNKLTRLFLHIHGLLHSITDLDQAETGVKSINATLTALVATQSFTSDKLIKLTIINMYALWHIVGVTIMKSNDLTDDEIKARELILDLIAGSLSAFLLPIYTLKNDETLLDYYALPAIKLICYWIEQEPAVLNETVFTNRLQIWPGFCKLVNSLQLHLKDFNYEKRKRTESFVAISNNLLGLSDSSTPLQEDKQLQGFLPLIESFRKLDFKLEILQSDCDVDRYIRANRIVNFGTWLMTFEVNNTKLIVSKQSDEHLIPIFEPGCIQPDPTNQLLELMKSVNVSEAVEGKKTKAHEKRTGILKPQGSLEKSREEREQINQTGQTSDSIGNSNGAKVENNKLKRVKQNVALQSIFKKMEENKQVKFSEETTDKESDRISKQKPTMKVSMPSAPQINQPYRTQTFNQNHPGLSNNLHHEYYNSGFPSHTNITDVNASKSMYFQNADLKNNLANSLSKIPQNIQFSMPPPAPPVQLRMMPNVQNTSQNALSYPGNMNMNVMDKPNTGANMPMPFRSSTWMNDEQRPHPNAPATNWWNNQQVTQPPENFQQRDSYINFTFNNSLPFGQTNNVSMNMDFNQQQQQNQNNMYSPWGNVPRNTAGTAQMPNFNNSSQGLTIRQAMLNETKHISGSMGPNTNELHGADSMQPPGYSLFDTTNWQPTLSHLRSSDNASQRSVANMPHQSLFSGPSHSSLMQLLEQQNQYQKNEK